MYVHTGTYNITELWKDQKSHSSFENAPSKGRIKIERQSKGAPFWNYHEPILGMAHQWTVIFALPRGQARKMIWSPAEVVFEELSLSSQSLYSIKAQIALQYFLKRTHTFTTTIDGSVKR